MVEYGRPPAGTRVYAIGDIHGRADLLDAMLALVAADARGSAASRKIAVFMGDYVDRGPDSRGVIERLLQFNIPGIEPIYLKGNHEAMMLTFLDRPWETGPGWVWNGGGTAMASYGVACNSDDLGPLAMIDLARALDQALPDSHLEFLTRTVLSWDEGGLMFVHAGIRPGVPLLLQDPHDLMWIRDEFLAWEAPHERFVIHGHSITPEPEIRANRIGIDTGAWKSGRLTALVLEGDERRFLHTDGPPC
ncbi:MAG: serine/threonine protein phosphatase [Rhodospirillales bacterium]|nr:serine/threonine protein phosphatase [Rhodospirillales bacterium]